MIGQTLGHYHILGKIGAGGMGEVYRATDSKLGREVALKVLPPDMARDPERLARFQREARAVAALNHPHIVTIFSVEESDGIPFLTMELVEGQSLDRVISEGGLPVQRIIEIAGALAGALAAAHEKGIVHRDLKPANVMVADDGRIKILDFGLAKDIRADQHTGATMTSAGQTEVGVVMGTPAYMSPEQVSGRPLDHRTDIFSLGVVLHQMATGKQPFHGNSSAELISAILRDDPPPVTELRPELPADLSRIIRRCLEKDPGHRVQTARDVANEFRDLARQSSLKVSVSPLRAVDSGAARAEQGFWVAVLPFKSGGSNSDLAALAEGLTEDIVTGLSRFSYLRVIARSSTQRYANQAADLRTIGKELGARYMMEGSLRLVGATLRLAVQLVDTSSGAHLWAETYDRPFKPESVLELQDDLVPRIVSTVADQYGILPRTMSEVLRSKSEDQLTPHEAVLRTFSYFERITPDEHAIVRRILERAVKNAPDQSDCWAMLSMIYRGEYAQGFNPGPDPLSRAVAAAQRAVQLAPSNHLGYWALATSLFFQKDKLGFRAAADRVIALNRMDGSTTAFMGLLIAYAGDWDRGCKLVESAMQLNPNHPGWYQNALFVNAYNKGQYAEALEAALRINMPGYFATHAALAAALGQLGRREAAQKAVRDLLTLRPDFATAVRDEFSKWWEPELVEHFIEGLRKAGLETAEDSGKQALAPTTSGATPTTTGSGATRADEGFWVAVLPFKYSGANTDLTALAEGLTEDVVTGLSRFSYLRVIARSSTLRYVQGDVRSAGKELGARYVMEGSLRQAGTKLRITVQLVDTHSGAHLWAETYDRPFQPDAVFELLDDLVPRIVSTVADTHGVLPYSMSQTLRGKNQDQLTPYEAFLRGFSYFKHVNAEEHASVRAGLERAVQQAPGNSDCWALLAMLYREENNHGFNVRPDPVGRALAAARRAIDIAPSNHLAHHALASVLFFRKEIQAFRSSAERAIALNPLDGFTMAYMGFLLAYSGDWERGCELVEKARNLNPNHPGWYWFPPFFNAYRKGDYRGALEFALKVNMPGFWRNELALAATYGQLGELEMARNAARELLEVRPDFTAIARQECSKWWDPQLVDQLVDGLRRAGLEIPEKATMSAPGVTAPKVASTSGPLVPPAIAVLPFQNLSGDPEQEYFADGITEEIINTLAHIPGLRVAGRSSAFSFKGRNEDLRSVGAKLGVATILEGTLRRSGDRLRITAQLIDASSGYQLWSERYDRVMEDVFAVQDEIAGTIAGRLRLSLAADRGAQAVQPPTRNMSAYELYLKGRGLLYQRGPSIGKAIDCFKEAVALDPEYAQAWAGLADGYTTSGYSGYTPASETMPRALEAARRALQLDPDLAEAHSALACATLLYELNFALAEQEFRRALELNPSYPQGRSWYGLFFLQWVAGREHEGREELLKLHQLDPLSAYANVILCFSGVSSGRFSEAVDHGRRGLELDPNSYLAHWSLTNALLCSEQYEDAAAVCERALAMSGRHSWALSTLVLIYAAWGKPDNARAAYRELEARSAREFVQPSMLAPAAAAIGDMDQAIAFAQRALDEKDPLLVMLARTWPTYNQLRTEARFLQIVNRLGLPG